MFLYYHVTMSLRLAVFSLIPVPPFDGSPSSFFFCRKSCILKLMKYERYIMLAVLALTFLGLLNRLPCRLSISCGLSLLRDTL